MTSESSRLRKPLSHSLAAKAKRLRIQASMGEEGVTCKQEGIRPGYPPVLPPLQAGLLASSHLLCRLGHKVIPQGAEDKAQGIPELVAEMAVVQDLRDRQVQVATLRGKNMESAHPQPVGLSTDAL